MSKPQIHITVDRQKKKEWEEYYEEHPAFENLSQLIRYSVRKEIYQDDENDDVDELEDVLNEIRKEIENLNVSMRAIDNDMLAEESFTEFKNNYDNTVESIVDRLLIHELDEYREDIREIVQFELENQDK